MKPTKTGSVRFLRLANYSILSYDRGVIKSTSLKKYKKFISTNFFSSHYNTSILY